jgi:DNA-binding transcriptional LysR family regulator
MSHHLDSELLRTFVAVADTGNFTRAAEMVARTQSAVSMQIKRLEDAVGGELFVRGPRGVSLTPRADHLLGNARRIVALLDETAARMNPGALVGRVRIGIPEEYGQTVISRALNAFSLSQPNVEISVRFGSSSDHLARVKAGELDVAVVFEWQAVPDGEVLMSDPTVWVTSNTHCQHERTPLPIALYGSSGWCRAFALESLESRGLNFRTSYVSETSGGLKLAVTSGLAIAPISRSNIPPDCRELTVEDGFGDIDASQVVMHVNPAAGSHAVAAMADAIRGAFASRLPEAAGLPSG